jgi:hypothetical protein
MIVVKWEFSFPLYDQNGDRVRRVFTQTINDRFFPPYITVFLRIRTRRYTIVIRSHVNRRIFPYTIVYDRGCLTWVLPKQRSKYSFRSIISFPDQFNQYISCYKLLLSDIFFPLSLNNSNFWRTWNEFLLLQILLMIIWNVFFIWGMWIDAAFMNQLKRL